MARGRRRADHQRIKLFKAVERRDITSTPVPGRHMLTTMGDQHCLMYFVYLSPQKSLAVNVPFSRIIPMVVDKALPLFDFADDELI